MTYNSSTHTTAPVPSRTGYTFEGWYASETSNNGSGTKVFNADGSKNTNITTYWNSSGYWCRDIGDNGATLTLYAKWSANTTTVYLKYIKDGDDDAGTYTTFQTYIMTCNSNSFVLSTDQTTTRTDVRTSTGKVDISKEGYDFAGWYAERTISSTETASTQVFGSTGLKVTSTGYWVASSSSSSTLVWRCSSSTITLYAHWTPHTSYVTFDANGGTGSMSSLTCSYGTATTLTDNAFTRTGYTFVGWNAYYDGKYYYTNKAGTSFGWYEEGEQPSGWKKVTYANGASYTPLLSDSGVTVTMKALWRNSNAAWDMSNILEDYYMFYGDIDITGGDADDSTTYDSLHIDSSYAKIDGGKNTDPGYFTEK